MGCSGLSVGNNQRQDTPILDQEKSRALLLSYYRNTISKAGVRKEQPPSDLEIETAMHDPCSSSSSGDTGYIPDSQSFAQSLDNDVDVEMTQRFQEEEEVECTSAHTTTARAGVVFGWVCVECLESFPLSHQLESHAQMTKHKPYVCYYAGCQKRYQRADTLSRHQREVHIQRGQDDYLCPFCSQDLKRSDKLKLHMKKVHSFIVDGFNDEEGEDLELLRCADSGNPLLTVDRLQVKLEEALGRDHEAVQIIEKHRYICDDPAVAEIASSNPAALLTVEELTVALAKATLKDSQDIAKPVKQEMQKLTNSMSLFSSHRLAEAENGAPWCPMGASSYNFPEI